MIVLFISIYFIYYLGGYNNAEQPKQLSLNEVIDYNSV
jgi:hypothetical protein